MPEPMNGGAPAVFPYKFNNKDYWTLTLKHAGFLKSPPSISGTITGTSRIRLNNIIAFMCVGFFKLPKIFLYYINSYEFFFAIYISG